MDLAAGRDEVADSLAELNKRMQRVSLPASLAGPERHHSHCRPDPRDLRSCAGSPAARPSNYFGPAASACPHRIGDDGAPLPGRGSQPAIASAAP